MATFKVFVNPKQIKEDKTLRVYIRLTHKREWKPITTNHYVTKKQLDKNNSIKDDELSHILSLVVKGYRQKCDALSTRIDQMDCEQLREYLLRAEVKNVDFIEFARGFIDKIKVKGTRDNANTTLSSFIDFVGVKIDINEISLVTIRKYEAYIRSPREIERSNNPGVTYKKTVKGVSDTAVKDYMTKLKNWYVEAMKHYNDRGNIIIPYNPFDKYEAPKQLPTADKNLTAKQIIQLKRCGRVSVGKYNRVDGTQLAKDVAMLAFYLIGINAVDLYQVDSYKDGRISYNRAKTASRRGDNAYISIKVVPEAIELVNKYLDPSKERVFIFHKLYKSHDGLTKALNAGLKNISDHLKWGLDISFIWIRYSWPNIARNDCRIPIDDVAQSMNHSGDEHKTTDIYLAKDWSIIDDANRKVLDYLATIERKEIAKSIT